MTELSLECASTYYEYGAALLYKARDDADVFGAPLQQAADEHGQDPLGLGDFSAGLSLGIDAQCISPLSALGKGGGGVPLASRVIQGKEFFPRYCQDHNLKLD